MDNSGSLKQVQISLFKIEKIFKRCRNDLQEIYILFSDRKCKDLIDQVFSLFRRKSNSMRIPFMSWRNDKSNIHREHKNFYLNSGKILKGNNRGGEIRESQPVSH